MNFILITAGTSGDVLPVLQLARALRPRCDRIHVIAPFTAKPIADFNGIPVSPIASEAACRRSDLDLHLLTTRYREIFVSRHAIPWNANILSLLNKLSDQETVLITVARGFLWADICAGLHDGQATFRVHIDPPGGDAGLLREELPASIVQRDFIERSGVVPWVETNG